MSLGIAFVAGPPGAGKTTVTRGYQENHPSTEEFGAGDLVRGIAAGRVSSKYSAVLRQTLGEGRPIPDNVFSAVISERISRVDDTADLLMITGFPYGYMDWEFFRETVDPEINLLGAVALSVGLETSIARMQNRDIGTGVDVAVAYSDEERVAYEERYHGLMARLVIRLDCYERAGLGVVPISAERPRDIVLTDFTKIIEEFKKESDGGV